MATANRSSGGGLPEVSPLEGVHLCHIFSDDEERARTMSRSVSQWLTEGAKVLCLEDAETRGHIRELLAELGVDLSGKEQALLTASAEDTYCPIGGLVPEVLLEGFEGFCRQAVSDGFSGVRITGDMGWAVRRRIARERLLEYEIKATACARRNRVLAVCEYDARKFDGGTIMDILSVHPAMLVRGQIVRNPHYVEPEEFLARRQSRADGSTRA
jgi:hypothetical protein